jgi:outer membrane protein assembly factor BamB
MTQWLGRPYLAPLPLVLVAKGRMAAVRLLGWGSEAVLEVHDSHNGVLLWRRQLPDASAATRTSAMVLLPDALYLAEGPRVLVFDPATGKQLSSIDCAELGAQVKWLAVERSVVHVMAGSGERSSMASQTWKVFGTPPANFALCRAMGAYDLGAGRWLWTHKEKEEVLDEGLVGLCGGRLYYYASGRHVACREAKTGRLVWENPKPVEKVKQFAKADFRGHIGAMVCTPRFLALHKASCGTLVLSAADGEPLWSLTAAAILLNDDLLLRKGGSNWGNPPVFDAATGKPVASAKKMNFGGGCGAFTLTPNLLCGQMGVTYDFKSGKDLDAGTGYGPLVHKTPCLSGSFVGEGQLFYGSVACTCDYTVRGVIVQSPAPKVLLEGREAPDSLRRARDSAKVEPLAVDSADWPTFRANAQRSDASRAKVPSAAAAIRWTWRPVPEPATQKPGDSPAKPAEPDPLESDREPVQATAAGMLVFVTGTDGTVSALDLATGMVRWRFATGGRLFAPPTIADGRCFLGSGDGVVYSLEARSGRELWRRRVAPADRRILAYGDLLSTWPITGGVLAEGGVVYTVAGILDVDGTYVAALDAASGEVKWCNLDSGHVDAYRRTGVAGVGYPALAKGRLWLRRASYDLATGECRPYATPKKPFHEMTNGVMERYTGVFADAFLITGGRRFFDQQVAVHQDRSHGLIQFMEVSSDGTGKRPAVAPWQRCRTMPAWDERSFVAMPAAHYHWSADGKKPPFQREEDLVCWDTARTVENLRKTIDEPVKPTGPVNPTGYRLYLGDRTIEGKDFDKGKGEKLQVPQQIWIAEKPRYIAAVLGANVAVAAHGTPAVPGLAVPGKPKAEEPAYGVTAYDRSDGRLMWEVTLPGEPLMDGLSIARDGTVLVRLLDGALVAIGAGDGAAAGR